MQARARRIGAENPAVALRAIDDPDALHLMPWHRRGCQQVVGRLAEQLQRRAVGHDQSVMAADDCRWQDCDVVCIGKYLWSVKPLHVGQVDGFALAIALPQHNEVTVDVGVQAAGDCALEGVGRAVGFIPLCQVVQFGCCSSALCAQWAVGEECHAQPECGVGKKVSVQHWS